MELTFYIAVAFWVVFGLMLFISTDLYGVKKLHKKAIFIFSCGPATWLFWLMNFMSYFVFFIAARYLSWLTR
jgi:hypothetical protein